MNRVPRTRVARAFRRTALPLASYYAVTLAVPLANGAARSGAFVDHALAVLVVPPIAIIVACVVHALFHKVSGVITPVSGKRLCSSGMGLFSGETTPRRPVGCTIGRIETS